MKRSEHFNVVAGKWLNGYSLSVNGRKYAISGVSPDNKLVLHCLDANDIVCEYSDLSLGSSHIFVNDCDHVICDARRVFVDGKSHHELYVVDKGDEWRSYWVEGSYVIGANCCTIRFISDFLREKNKFFCGDIVAKYDGGVPTYYFVDAFTDVMGIFTVVFRYLDSDGKIAHCYSDKGMYHVREEVAFEHWLSRGFKYDNENNALCPIFYELTDNSYVFYCSDEPVSVLANWKIGTYGFAKDKFPLIVPFHKFNPDNIGGSLQHNVVKQQ